MGEVGSDGIWLLQVVAAVRAVTEGESEKEEVRCLVIGDSRMRPLGRVFCEKKDRCVVKPGATISEVGTVIQEV